MQFTLTYRGQLKSKASAMEKHSLRQHFHRQLAILWTEKPLVDCRNWLEPTSTANSWSLLRPKEQFIFAPLVTEPLRAVVELNVVLLWPQAIGSIIVSGGDIDNRLKTLFDSLKMPSSPSDLPPSAQPVNGENPFFCLLEDDSLISKVTVATDRLLEPTSHTSEVALYIQVHTRNLSDQHKSLP